MKPKSHSPKKRIRNTKSEQDNAVTSRIRRELAVLAAILLVIISTIAAFQNGAMPVLDKLFPLLVVVFAFFFESKSHSRQS